MERYLNIRRSLQAKRQAVCLGRNRRRVAAANVTAPRRPLLQLPHIEDDEACKNRMTQVTPADNQIHRAETSTTSETGPHQPQRPFQENNFVRISEFGISAVAESDDFSTIEIPVKCTLAIFNVTSTTKPGRKHKLGNELMKLSQTGNMRKNFNNLSKDGLGTRIIFSNEFLIPLELLGSAKPHLVPQGTALSRNGLDLHTKSSNIIAETYGLKLWIQILGDNQDLRPLGSVGEGIVGLKRDSQSKNVQIMCKGNLFPKPESRLNLKILLISDDTMRKTEDRLQALVAWPRISQPAFWVPHRLQHYSLPPSPLAGSTAPTTFLPLNSTKPQHPKSQFVLLVPKSRSRLFHHETKQLLIPGEIYTAYDHEADHTWRIAKIQDELSSDREITQDAIDYVTRWAAFAFPLRISSSTYIPEALLRFVQANQTWFAERKNRVREFGLHATVLRLRGFLTIGDLMKCTRLLATRGT